MEKLEDNIDKFLLRRIAYNIPEKAKLKRVKLKGEILDSPVLASKKYHYRKWFRKKRSMPSRKRYAYQNN